MFFTQYVIEMPGQRPVERSVAVSQIKNLIGGKHIGNSHFRKYFIVIRQRFFEYQKESVFASGKYFFQGFIFKMSASSSLKFQECNCFDKDCTNIHKYIQLNKQ